MNAVDRYNTDFFHMIISLIESHQQHAMQWKNSIYVDSVFLFPYTY